MNKIFICLLAAILTSCASSQNIVENSSEAETRQVTSASKRTPTSSQDLTGTYLGEGLFQKRSQGIRRPAMRLYLERAQGEADTYYAALLEYDRLLAMALPFLSSNHAPALNHVFGYLDKIATRIAAYKVLPGSQAGAYNFHVISVKNGQITHDREAVMTLNLGSVNDPKNKLAGAIITGDADGVISFPSDAVPSEGPISDIGNFLRLSEFKLATATYSKGKLASTWRGNFNDLESSYLSEYGRLKDGVLELYSQNGQNRAKFIKTNKTNARDFTNPKSANIVGDYIVTEPVPKIFVLTPVSKNRTSSDAEMMPRLGLFLDVFDASAQGQKVTEIAFTNPDDPEDFMMYYQHPDHTKNVGVEPATKKRK